MLAKHNNKIDIDGYSMFILSGLVMIATAGISYLFCFKKIFQTAKVTTHDCEKNVVLCVLGKKLINNKPDSEYLLRLHRTSHILSNDEQSQAILLGGKTGKNIPALEYKGFLDFVRKENPDICISAGGFISVPLHWAAWLYGCKTWIHQQDVKIGFSLFVFCL